MCAHANQNSSTRCYQESFTEGGRRGQRGERGNRMWEPEERRPRVALEKHGIVSPPPTPPKPLSKPATTARRTPARRHKGASVMENDLQCLSGRLERAIVKVKNERVFTCPSNHLWPLPTPLVVAGGRGGGSKPSWESKSGPDCTGR